MTIETQVRGMPLVEGEHEPRNKNNLYKVRGKKEIL